MDVCMDGEEGTSKSLQFVGECKGEEEEKEKRRKKKG